MPRLNDDQYARLLAKQGGGCATCGRKPTPGRRLNEDHDHTTGLSRGLLCTWCNRYLVGNKTFKHRALFMNAAWYLANPPAQKLFPGRKLVRRKKTRRKKHV